VKGRAGLLWSILLLGSLSAFGPLSIDLYLPALPELADKMNASSSYAQLTLTSCMIGLSVGQLFAGPISDFRGRRGPLLIGVAIYAVASILCAFSPSIGALVALRFVQGLAGSAGIVISRAIVRDMYSGPELTKFYAMLMLVNGAAPILSPVIGGQLLKFTSWEGLFVVLSVWGAMTLLAVGFGLRETLPVEKRMTGGLKETFSTFRTLLGDRLFMGYALSQALVTAAMFAYISGSPFVLQNIYGVSPQMFSVFFAINGAGIIIAGQITGRLAARFGEKKLFLTGLLIAMTGGLALLAVIVAGGGLTALLVPLFFAISSVGIVGATGFTLAMSKHGHAAGSASALLGLLAFLFGAALAPLVGIAGSANAMPMGVLIAAANVGAFACYFLMVRKADAGA